MRYRKQGLGLFVVVILGAMTLAHAAQAAAPQFLINKKAVGALKATVEMEQVGAGNLSIPTLNIKIDCKTFTVQEAVIESGVDAKGKLLFEECKILENIGGKELSCTIYASSTDSRPHITSTGLLLPAELKNGEPALLLEKVKSLILLKGPECVLPTDNIVMGQLCLKIDNNDTAEPLGLASQSIQGECRGRQTVLDASEKEISGLEALGQEVNPLSKEAEEELAKLEAQPEPKVFLDKFLYGTNLVVVERAIKVLLVGAHKGMTLGVSL